MKPLSGSGARGMMVETMQTHGADSFAGRLASVIQGSTETTFYVLAVYFGAVGIRRTRHAVVCGLAADSGGDHGGDSGQLSVFWVKLSQKRHRHPLSSGLTFFDK